MDIFETKAVFKEKIFFEGESKQTHVCITEGGKGRWRGKERESQAASLPRRDSITQPWDDDPSRKKEMAA